MSARVCRSCEYNVVSTVVTDCPNCGERLPSPLVSSSPTKMMGLVIVLLAGVGGWMVVRRPVEALRPPVAPSVAPPRPTLAAAPARAASPRPAARPRDDAEVERLIARLGNPETSWSAGYELAKRATPRAEQALMAAYDRRDFGKMAGACAFYARKRPPGYEKVLVALLDASKDLAVAQDLILSRDPKLAEPARKWAATLGFKLVKDPASPEGVTWTSVSTPPR